MQSPLVDVHFELFGERFDELPEKILVRDCGPRIFRQVDVNELRATLWEILGRHLSVSRAKFHPRIVRSARFQGRGHLYRFGSYRFGKFTLFLKLPQEMLLFWFDTSHHWAFRNDDWRLAVRRSVNLKHKTEILIVGQELLSCHDSCVFRPWNSQNLELYFDVSCIEIIIYILSIYIMISMVSW